ncbi:DMT family transporter [Chromobacterium vaccinii]|uniref:DMT family transporter n=1 Tax=Chromobacterium vaccinii TaxID=1108595 RepID=UPI001E3CF473|nr:EamA family transporter [Chromobacterium vaccinii]MCD4500485.1 EamA family transporter [Chromobacterium vaccinii]
MAYILLIYRSRAFMFYGLLFISVCLIWGSTWLAMAIAIESIPPLFATGLRFIFAAPLLMALAKWQGVSLKFTSNVGLSWVAIGYFAIPYGLMMLAEKYVSSGFAAVVFANMPLVVMLVSMIQLRERFKLLQYTGLLAGVVAMISILLAETRIGGGDYILGVIFLGGALLMHAVFYVAVRAHFCKVHVLSFNAVPSCIAGVLLLIIGWVWERPNLLTFDLPSIFAVLYLGVIASIGGIVAYFKLNQLSSPFQASLCFLVFPLVALLLDKLVCNQQLSEQSYWLLIPLFIGIVLCKAPSLSWAKNILIQLLVFIKCKA